MSKRLVAATIAFPLAGTTVAAQVPLSAQASNAITMGWMQGFSSASNPVAVSPASDPTSLTVYRVVADYLMAQDAAPDLVGPEWVVEDIADRGVIDSSHASLQFMPDGRVVGSGSCNRLMGSYTRNKSALSLKSVGTTRMACPPALMDQEQRLLALLPRVVSYTIDGSGALILTSRDGTSITARRP
ncbi:heat shock protein HslJ [Rhodanobacter sp. TND4EL1]